MQKEMLFICSVKCHSFSLRKTFARCAIRFAFAKMFSEAPLRVILSFVLGTLWMYLQWVEATVRLYLYTSKHFTLTRVLFSPEFFTLTLIFFTLEMGESITVCEAQRRFRFGDSYIRKI